MTTDVPVQILNHPICLWVQLILFFIGIIDALYKILNLYKKATQVTRETYSELITEIAFVAITVIIFIATPLFLLLTYWSKLYGFWTILSVLLVLSLVVSFFQLWFIIFKTKKKLDKIDFSLKTDPKT